MPQLLKHRKIIRSVVIAKRPLRSCFRRQSCKPLCEKLKNNNNSLAKALSKEKQESQLLFSQNVALIAEVQDLNVACDKRDAVISSVLKNAKEMLNMLVTMTGYLTHTISTCQEFTSSVTNLRMSSTSTGKRDSYKSLSTKSPTRGVVKPMVGGHTITKPTISLSRVNMQHINNPSNLSMIQEVSTPPRTQELNNSRSPPVPVSVRQRYENRRACRMPERLTVVSPRNSGENERRLSKRSGRHSGRMSGIRSRLKSDRLSAGNISRRSSENIERIGSPTVKLNDVSKLLQNSQSINIRMLADSGNDEVNAGSENENDTNRRSSQRVISIPETPSSDDSNNNNDNNVDNRNESIDDELHNVEKESTEKDENESSTGMHNDTTNWEDPLEGPSWLFNSSQSVPCVTNNEEKTDVGSLSESNTSKADLSHATDSEECMQMNLPGMNKYRNKMHDSKKNKQKKKCKTDDENKNNSLCNVPTSSNCTNENKIENEPAPSTVNFVTQRRVYFKDEEEDEDDFTLMYARQPNMHFDLNDLKLPVLEESTLKPTGPVEPEPEITTTLRKISQICPVPSLSNHTLDESAFNQSTVKLPVLTNPNNDYDAKDLTPLEDKLKSFHSRRKVKGATVRTSNEFVNSTPTFKRKINQRMKKDQPANKDPSTAKVVLQKLNESDVKSRTPSPEEISRDFNVSLRPVFLRTNSSDSESSNSSIESISAMNRPRRKRAPRNLQEPSLRKKLRRNR